MSDADNGLSAFIAGDHLLPAVTADRVASALKGFAVPLLPSRNYEWLAMAVRRALAISLPSASDGPSRKSNAEIRCELEQLSSLAASTWADLFHRDHAADHKLWRFALGRWDGDGGIDCGDGMVLGDPADYKRFTSAVAELEWAAGFLRDAARATESQRGPWRQSEERQIRVLRGQYLAVIYEAAFGVLVSSNNFPSDATVPAPTAFMDFYGRMVSLALGQRETTNLTDVLKEACKLHRQQPARFAEGIIPGL